MNNYALSHKIVSKIIKLSIQNTLKSDQKVLALMKENSKITIYELMEKLSMSESGIKKVIKKLKDENIISGVGSLKSGYWEIIPKVEDK
ncbi:winged helix-turn-helix domain-containing protein [Arcobacter cloacae]|nr:winged helix-turn-helix transcriptional regulator [Arcobacter cloacae]